LADSGLNKLAKIVTAHGSTLPLYHRASLSDANSLCAAGEWK